VTCEDHTCPQCLSCTRLFARQCLQKRKHGRTVEAATAPGQDAAETEGRERGARGEKRLANDLKGHSELALMTMWPWAKVARHGTLPGACVSREWDEKERVQEEVQDAKGRQGPRLRTKFASHRTRSHSSKRARCRDAIQVQLGVQRETGGWCWGALRQRAVLRPSRGPGPTYPSGEAQQTLPAIDDCPMTSTSPQEVRTLMRMRSGLQVRRQPRKASIRFISLFSSAHLMTTGRLVLATRCWRQVLTNLDARRLDT
jgi:hypothetical protein